MKSVKKYVAKSAHLTMCTNENRLAFLTCNRSSENDSTNHSFCVHEIASAFDSPLVSKVFGHLHQDYIYHMYFHICMYIIFEWQ